jgi:Ca2+-binding RTX toxin-like protein
LPKFVSSYKALISGTQWSNLRVVDGEYVITYSFPTSAPDYAESYEASKAFIKSFNPLNSDQEAAARKALKLWDKASGIRFVEDKSGEGDIVFATYSFSADGGGAFSGFAFYPIDSGDSTTSDDSAKIGGDVFINADDPLSTSADVHLYLHEIGHALGLKHPFEGDIQLKKSLDNVSTTVMSYTGDWANGQKLGKLDIKAIQSIYGEDDGKRSNKNKSEKLFGDDSDDRFDGKGGNDRIEGRGGDDLLSGGKGNDKLFGGDSADILSGGKGKDQLDGGAGDDTLTGGSGKDTFVFNDTVGVDTISDFTSGTDKIKLTNDLLYALEIYSISSEDFAVDPGSDDPYNSIIYLQGTGELQFQVYDAVTGQFYYKTMVLLGAGTALSFNDLSLSL